jgi:hypothetical protein
MTHGGAGSVGSLLPAAALVALMMMMMKEPHTVIVVVIVVGADAAHVVRRVIGRWCMERGAHTMSHVLEVEAIVE